MKKFRFFVVVLALFALLGFSKTINAQETVNVTITVKKDDTQVGEVVSTTGTLGGTIKVDTLLPEVTDATFMFWTVNGVVRTDLGIDSLIKVTSKLNLVAHYASTGKYSVAYLDANTKLIDVDYVSVGGTLTPPVLGSNPKDVPGRKGTSFDGWALITNYEAPASTTLENPGAKAYFVAKYTVTEVATYKVTVVGGTADKENYTLNEVATVTATNPTEFSYWMDETGMILSTNSTYSFTILERNESIEAVYDASFVSGPMVSIRKFIDYKTGKDAFVGHYELGENYEFIEVGFIHDNYLSTPHITKNINASTNEFMVVAPNSLGNNLQKMRAYLTYKDKVSNAITTIYSVSSGERWQVINDPTNSISYNDEGTINYVDVTGAEEVLMTTHPLTTGEGVIGYEVEFDFLYQTNEWEDWYAFTFYKTAVGKGLHWAASGYLLGRNTSLQTVHGSDSAAIGGNLAPYETMTPHIPIISNQNIRFRFVYNNANKTAELYYDLVGETMDLTTLRNTFTFGGLEVGGAYHFGIISSGKGLFELDNFKIKKLTNTAPIVYLDEDFNSTVLPSEISIIDATKFSHELITNVELNKPLDGAMFLTQKPVLVDNSASNKLSVSYTLNAQILELDGLVSFVYGLSSNRSLLTDDGITQIYFVNRDIGGVPITHIGALKGNGTETVQVLTEQSLGVNIVTHGAIEVLIEFLSLDNVKVTVLGSEYNFNGASEIGLLGFKVSSGTHIFINKLKLI